jgi:copper homeostasis protein CutC
MRALFEPCVRCAGHRRDGADRIDLCARMDVGGTTPDPALIGRCAALGIPFTS